jgi:hypothetical protein
MQEFGVGSPITSLRIVQKGQKIKVMMAFFSRRLYVVKAADSVP